jgi:hypothetical protein
LQQSRRERRQQKHSLVKRSSSSSITESIAGIECYLVPTYVYLVPGSMLDLPTYLPTYLPSSVANLIGHNFCK